MTGLDTLRKLCTVGLVCVLAGALGCEKKSGTSQPAGGGSAPPVDAGTGESPAPAGKQAWPAETGTIVGKIKIARAPPKMPLINMGSKPECVALHSGAKPVSDLVVVGADSGLGDVVVFVTGVSAKFEGIPKPAAEPVVLNQKGCVYSPHVIGIRVGQSLTLRNSDGFLHNVNCQKIKLNAAMGKSGDLTKKKPFKKADLGVAFKCDVHPWMSAWACVFDHPCYAVTDKDGNFKIEGVPPGKYQVDFWHEKSPFTGKKPAPVEVEVTAGQEATVAASY